MVPHATISTTVDYLVKEKYYFDRNIVHMQDFKKYHIAWDEYLNQYFIGHYSPLGTTFLLTRSKTGSSSGWTPSPYLPRSGCGSV
jgi:hypothetical protein